ncbi:hypothetical protein [Paenibacillus sp. NRS-1760]
MDHFIPHKIFTVCLITHGRKVLLMNRTHDDFSGYIAPGGRVGFFEA